MVGSQQRGDSWGRGWEEEEEGREYPRFKLSGQPGEGGAGCDFRSLVERRGSRGTLVRQGRPVAVTPGAASLGTRPQTGFWVLLSVPEQGVELRTPKPKQRLKKKKNQTRLQLRSPQPRGIAARSAPAARGPPFASSAALGSGSGALPPTLLPIRARPHLAHHCRAISCGSFHLGGGRRSYLSTCARRVASPAVTVMTPAAGG